MAVLRLVPVTGAPPVEIDKDQAVVGRDPGSDVAVNDGSVSRRHARLERRGAAWFVVDQGSANGTYLDSQRVSDALLRPGQELRFGAVAFRVEIVGGELATDGTMLVPGGVGMPAAAPPPVVPTPGAPPQWPTAPAPVPPQWPAAPARPAPPQPAPPGPPRPAAPAPATPPGHAGMPPPAGRPPGPPPPPPPSATDTTPYAGAPARRARPAAMGGEAPPPPAKQGRGPIFWTFMGCGGCLLAVLLLVGAAAAFFYFSAQGPREAVQGHLNDLRSGNVDAAYEDLSEPYRQLVSREAYGLFVARHPGLSQHSGFSFRGYSSEGSNASLEGYLNSAKGDRETATFGLVEENGRWKISAIDVGADHPEAQQVQEPGGLRIDAIAAQKRPSGSTTEVPVTINVAGFDVRPEGGQYRIDLAVDVETIGPDGARVEALSRDDVQRFQRTTTMEKGAVAPIVVPLIVDGSMPPGSYTIRVRVRDRVGGGQASQETQVALP